MTYAAISHFAQQAGSIYFVTVFIGACVYAFWPRNKAAFDRAARAPLDDDNLSDGDPS